MANQDSKTTIGRSTVARGQTPQIIEAKVILLGDSGVGKSSIAKRFVYD